MNKKSRRQLVQDSLPAIEGVIPFEAQRQSRARARRRSAWARGSKENRRGFPRRVTPLNLDWLTEPDTRGYKRGIFSGQCMTILSYLRHWSHSRPNMQVRAYGVTYLRVSIRQIARTIGRHKSLKNVWLCLRKLEQYEIITRRRMRHHIPAGTVCRRQGRPPLRGPRTVNGVGLIRFTATGSKLCSVERKDHLQEIKRIKDTPAYSGPGAWGQMPSEAFLGGEFYTHLQERFPGVLKRCQLAWTDFKQSSDERAAWPGNAGRPAPPPPASHEGPGP